MRILGVDIGSQGIKAVEVDSAFGRYEIHEYHEVAINDGAIPAHVLKRLVEGLHRKPDRIVVAINSASFTVRNLTLPTRDRKAILSSVQFELEDEIPISEDNAFVETAILSQKRNESTVHVAITLKSAVRKLLDFVNPALPNPQELLINPNPEFAEEATHSQLIPADLPHTGVDPDVVTTEAWAYRSVLNRVLAEPDQEKPVLLVHIGHERTNLYVHWRRTPIVCRDVHWGGKDLTLAICQKYQIPMDEAEQAKLDNAFVVPASEIPSVTPEQNEMSDTLYGPLKELLREIRQAKLSCKSLTQHSLETIYLTGGTSLLPGLVAVIADEIKVKTEMLKALSTIATSGVTYAEPADASFVLALGNAMALVPEDKVQPINFRKGEFSKSGRTQELNLKTLKRPAQGVTAVLFCMMLSLCVQSSLYRQEISGLDTQLDRGIKGFFPGVASTPLKNYKANPASLRAAVKKELDKQRDLARLLAPNPHSPLDFLKDLSTSVRKDLVVDLTRFQVGAGPATPYSPAAATKSELTFAFPEKTTAEQLQTILSAKMKDVSKTASESYPPLPESKDKRWKSTYTGDPMEASYAK